MTTLLPSAFLTTWAISTKKAFSELNTLTLAVARIGAKLGSDSRLTLAGGLFNPLDLASFAWRTKKSLFSIV
jgi:hypothetical protein